MAWDGPFVSYMDGLFLPLFVRLQERGFHFSILHFSWASSDKINAIAKSCQQAGVYYKHIPVMTKPHPVIGKLITLFFGARHIKETVLQQKCDTLMPRSLMPAKLSLRVINDLPGIRLIYDADGLPIEERVDFAGLRENSLRHRQLKKVERAMMHRANLVLCRTQRAISFLLAQYPLAGSEKFRIVINGRDEHQFTKSPPEDIALLKTKLGIPTDGFVLVYCGSLGPQYGVTQMLEIHHRVRSFNPPTYLLLLTGNPEYMNRFSDADRLQVIVRSIVPADVPRYLSLGQAGLALRKATHSMMGVAPIKLGEYLLMGLPFVASGGIGDTEDLLRHQPFCLVLDHLGNDEVRAASEWILNIL